MDFKQWYEEHGETLAALYSQYKKEYLDPPDFMQWLYDKSKEEEDGK